uniref:Uncharacterized protein n=1 Tax=Strigamia maritima TaxID=126957 RepID=T1IPK3_STRMM
MAGEGRRLVYLALITGQRAALGLTARAVEMWETARLVSELKSDCAFENDERQKCFATSTHVPGVWSSGLYAAIWIREKFEEKTKLREFTLQCCFPEDAATSFKWITMFLCKYVKTCCPRFQIVIKPILSFVTIAITWRDAAFCKPEAAIAPGHELFVVVRMRSCGALREGQRPIFYLDISKQYFHLVGCHSESVSKRLISFNMFLVFLVCFLSVLVFFKNDECRTNDVSIKIPFISRLIGSNRWSSLQAVEQEYLTVFVDRKSTL